MPNGGADLLARWHALSSIGIPLPQPRRVILSIRPRSLELGPIAIPRRAAPAGCVRPIRSCWRMRAVASTTW
jgi:hypothetical protein